MMAKIDGAELNADILQFFNFIHPYTDIEKFIELCAILANFLPLPMRLKLLNFRKHGNKEGFLLIQSLAQDPEIPSTPLKDEEAWNKNSFHSEHWLAIIANVLGEPFGYTQEGSGKLFHNIRPTYENKDKLSSESSSILLDFHTETAFHPVLPDFLLLYCLRDDRNKEAKTMISSIREFYSLLSPSLIRALREKKFKTGIDYSFGSENGLKGNGPILPILYGSHEDPLFLFDPDLMMGLTPEANNALKELVELVHQTKHEILLAPGDLLIVDNRRAIHGRNKFLAYYDGYDRWLQRLYVARDLLKPEILFEKKERIISHHFSTEGIRYEYA